MMKNDKQQYLCDIASLKSSITKGVEINGEHYLIITKTDDIFAYKNECPHLKIPLDWDNDIFLDPDGDLIQCSTHGALFTIDKGECIYGPCLGQHLTPVTVRTENEKVYLS